MNNINDEILFLSQKSNKDTVQRLNLNELTGKIEDVVNITAYMGRIMGVLGLKSRDLTELYRNMLDCVQYTGISKYQRLFKEHLDLNYALMACQCANKPLQQLIFVQNQLFEDLVLLNSKAGLTVQEQMGELLLIGLRGECDIVHPTLKQLIKNNFPKLGEVCELCSAEIGSDSRFDYQKLYQWLNLFTVQSRNNKSTDNILLPYVVDYLRVRGYASSLDVIDDALHYAESADISLLYNMATGMCLGSSSYKVSVISDIEDYKYSVLENSIKSLFMTLRESLGENWLLSVLTSTHYLTEVLCSDMLLYRKTSTIEELGCTLSEYFLMNTEFR